MAKGTPGVIAIFKDENVLLEAAKKTYGVGYREFETMSPFPVHGMDDAMGLKPSPVPWFTFIAGLIGCACGFGFQYWVHAKSWALNIGGKPFNSWPAYIPVTFEMTVLFGGLTTVAGMLYICGLPKVDPPILDPNLTCDKFALFIPANDKNYDERKVQDFLKTLGAEDVRKVAEF